MKNEENRKEIEKMIKNFFKCHFVKTKIKRTPPPKKVYFQILKKYLYCYNFYSYFKPWLVSSFVVFLSHQKNNLKRQQKSEKKFQIQK